MDLLFIKRWWTPFHFLSFGVLFELNKSTCISCDVIVHVIYGQTSIKVSCLKEIWRLEKHMWRSTSTADLTDWKQDSEYISKQRLHETVCVLHLLSSKQSCRCLIAVQNVMCGGPTNTQYMEVNKFGRFVMMFFFLFPNLIFKYWKLFSKYYI